MKIVNSLVITVLITVSAFPQKLTPPIQNYSSRDYEAASQNWDIDIDHQGIIYVANNQGLLSYDGQRWKLHSLKTGSIIRSVYTHNDRIYTGSYKEFGYWSRDNTGSLRYNSLMSLMDEEELHSDEFWEILSYKNAIYFRSFGAIYKYENDKITLVTNEVTNKMTVFKNRLLIAVVNSGLYYLDENGDMEALPNQDVLEGETIIDIEVKGEKLLIGTRDALYEFKDGKCSLFNDDFLNADLRRFELNHILALNENEIVLGTVKNGIIHYNITEANYSIYNRHNGLQNNTILRMVENNGNIWLSLDNGVDMINLNSPIEYFTDETGELGAVYDLTFFNEHLYLGSNTGVYRFVGDEQELIDGSEGHTWNLEVLNNELYANHNTGTYKIEKNTFEPVEERTGSFQILNVPNAQNSKLIATYTGLTQVNENGLAQTVEGINFPIRELLYQNPSFFLASHPYEGIYKIVLNDDLTSALSVDKLKDVDGKGHYNADISRINDQLAVYNGGKWFRYNSFSDSLEVFKELASFNNHKLLYYDSMGYWFTDTQKNSLVFTDLKDDQVRVAFPKIRERLVKKYEKLIKTNDSIYYVALNDGFARINLQELIRSRQNERLSEPIIRGFSDIEKRYDLSQMPVVPYNKARDILVQTALPVSDAAGMNYELIGEDTLRGKVQNGHLNFQNLRHGDYELNLFAVSQQKGTPARSSFAFRVNPPWYLSGLMKFVYMLLFLAFIGLIYWFNQLKLKKQHLLLEQKFEKEHKERLNQLEKERLMNEITLKRKELANTTMVAAKKNEVLMEIQGELNKDKSKFSNQFRLKHIMNKINRAIKNKDEWQVFETNFNEVHEDFFKDLLETYPQLTNKDLKLCSYLKMNLTSKEIAPLMGISVRGVEVHRYRLRKKMGLDKKENLTNFLIKNF
ncbi:helix-turn-helix and ligand-binding sensor domain-containing protein [Salegentibacter sediminis]|uniref:helix-turn-helix and ligand-binding sensor domain-containing protein n=1 Tax=Salegentibacter sediminis TaxID=1930251 RepID=UPI001E3C2048|nr:LuxR C-terminal-related transcriptional regulator [Salegentibacter sediminis]